ncbi:GNAT family N-acetyltransferase [Anaerolineae bacterium CFX9]|jgi:RimJ/RimL family protein N-acetyltransferase|nr:GNAT family N-acetyltransferase [Anaerolineae bacterium CFX9]
MFNAPRAPEIPDHLETERLLLRAMRAGDGAMINAAVHESFDQLHRWMAWARTRPSLGESETHARESAARWRLREELNYVILRRGDYAFVGSCGYHTIDWTVPRLEIGYWLHTAMQGQGYMTEAVREMTAFAFERLHAERLEIRCDARNRASAAVAERAGYTLEAVMRHQARDHHGDLRDTLVYSRIRGE